MGNIFGARDRGAQHLCRHAGEFGDEAAEARWSEELGTRGAHISTECLTVFADLLRVEVCLWTVTTRGGKVDGLQAFSPVRKGDCGNFRQLSMVLLFDFEQELAHYEPLIQGSQGV